MTVRLVNKSDKLILLEIYDLSEVHQVDVRQEDWPVQGDGEEVKDGGGAAEDVTGGPDVTEEGAEYPGTTYLIWVILEFLLTIDMGEVIWKSFKAFRKKSKWDFSIHGQTDYWNTLLHIAPSKYGEKFSKIQFTFCR